MRSVLCKKRTKLYNCIVYCSGFGVVNHAILGTLMTEYSTYVKSFLNTIAANLGDVRLSVFKTASSTALLHIVMFAVGEEWSCFSVPKPLEFPAN